MLTGFIWLRTETNSGLFWKIWWRFVYHKMWEFLDWLSYWKLKPSEMWRCLIVYFTAFRRHYDRSKRRQLLAQYTVPLPRDESSAKAQSEVHIWLDKSVPWNWVVRTATVVSSFPLWLRFRKVKVSLPSAQCSKFLKQLCFLEGTQASPNCPSGKSNRLQGITWIILVYKDPVRTAQ